MAQYRQSGDRFVVRSHDYHHGNGGTTADHVSVGIRIPHKQGRTRRSGRSEKSYKISVGAIIVILSLVLVVTVFAFNYLFRDKDLNGFHAQDDDLKNDFDFLTNVTRTKSFKVLGFGHDSGVYGRDSRYWDRDDRRRDEDYTEDVSDLTNIGANAGFTDNNHISTKDRSGNNLMSSDGSRENSHGEHRLGRGGIGLYNEAGRDELKQYEAEYEASLKSSAQTRQKHDHNRELSDGADLAMQNGGLDSDDEYDDGLGSHDPQMMEYDDTRHNDEDHANEAKTEDYDEEELSDTLNVGNRGSDAINDNEEAEEALINSSQEDSSLNLQRAGNVIVKSNRVSVAHGRSAKRSNSDKKVDPRRRGKRRKFSGSSCEMKFLNSTAQLVEPLESRKFSRFSLQYTEVEGRPSGQEQWEPRFAGHQSLQEREESFHAHDQKINCGFIRGPKGYPGTGFDLAEDDVRFMSRCHIAVSSCIFGNSDHLRTPMGKTVTRLSRKNVCFVMFVDEITLQTLSSEGQKPDRTGFVGLWKVVVVKNLPYNDMRRVGKIPKMLTHRLFPSARYSIWLDSKLRLQSDPLLILEYFLWRKGNEYAISNHYDRHCLWEEVAQNKKLNKFNHTIIDQQFAFYQADGLKRFNASDPKKLLPSNVPEGSFIVRAHTPMSNLFSCLWFNEVDRFTPRDQLSFAYTYMKLRRTNSEKPFYLNMFKDCERRSIAKLFHHRSEEKRSMPLQALG